MKPTTELLVLDRSRTRKGSLVGMVLESESDESMRHEEEGGTIMRMWNEQGRNN